jgi:cystathionine beta-lyase/cystathionine gamma-synthase
MKKETRVNHQPEVELPSGNRSIVSPVYRSVKFTYPTIADSLTDESRRHGFDYTRDSNPTTRQLELLCAELQDRNDAIAVATGMASVWLALLGNLEVRDRVVLFVETYRPTRVAVRRFLARFGVEHTMVNMHDGAAVEAAFGLPDTKLVIFESPTNPMTHVADIGHIVELARKNDVVTVLDNTFGGLHNHGQFEIDYFVHSLTKYAGGHGDTMGGIIIADKARIKAVRPLAVNMGSVLDPEVAFLMLRGLKTYYLRYRQHSENALAIAEFLAGRPEVKRVLYPGHQSHPEHALAARQMDDFGGVVSFDLDGGREETWAFIDALELFITTASLGSTDSLVAPAKLYSCGDLTADEIATTDISESTVRLAVGIEHVDDLIADLRQALTTVFGTPSAAAPLSS